jgi:hypothetical protein
VTHAEFFEAEARECLDVLRELLGRSATAEALRDPARRMRGSAQMASRAEAARAAAALERALRAAQSGTRAWTGGTRSEQSGNVDHQEPRGASEGADRVGDGAAIAERVVGRVAALGVDVSGEGRSGKASGPEDEFPTFARREIAAIRAALDEVAAAADEGPAPVPFLHALLDRQAALAGSARLAELPVMARALEASDHLTRAILAGTSSGRSHAEAFREIAAVLDEAPVEPDRAAPDLEARLERARGAGSGRPGADPDIPVEVANFFRTEARAELSRAAQLARDAADERTATAADRLHSGLATLATTAATFGFPAIAGRLERAVEACGDAEASTLPHLVALLESDVLAALGAEPAAASARQRPTKAAAPPPIVTAGGEEDSGAGEEPATTASPLAADAEGAVPIEALCYAGPAALDRAAELRAKWEAAEGGEARRIAAEVFDLIDLARR